MRTGGHALEAVLTGGKCFFNVLYCRGGSVISLGRPANYGIVTCCRLSGFKLPLHRLAVPLFLSPSYTA
ncbi:unnamed protein product [Protopolystoma xenopodis]|uniref:Uncharacterized protein n=1 Tax=Protopolystoma xenopodis TaxID=117903 RepID=A0A3S5AYN1_9PLAT|nr:unnamed protein product [Protopolystoma xenopodis]